MKKLIIISILGLYPLCSTFGQAFITNTMAITSAQDTSCVGITVSLDFTVSNTTTSPLTLSSVLFKIQFDNMSSPTIIGTTAPITMTIPALSTSSVYSVSGLLPSVVNGYYDIRVKMHNGITFINGTSPTVPHKIYVLNAPSTPVITASGTTALCPSASVILTASGGSAPYLWSPGGATTPSITVSAANVYTVSSTNVCGTSTSSSVSVTAVSLPTTTISVIGSGDTIFCQGISTGLHSISTAATSFIWSDGISTINNIVSTSGTYYTIVSNSCGVDTSNYITIVVNPNPVAPIISQVGMDSLFSNYPTGNIWSPTGDNTNYFVPASSGIYSVTYTDTNGCSSTSAPFNFTLLTGIESFDKLNLLSIYPNPATDYIVIENIQTPITICNSIGQIILNPIPCNGKIDISVLDKGIYFLRIEKNKKTVVAKFFKK